MTVSMEIVVKEDAVAVAREAAERVVTAHREAIAARGRFTFVLSGGSTPEALYRLLASPDYAPRIDWPRTEVFFGDERCVPPEHEWNCYGMARRALLDHVPLHSDAIHRIPAEHGPAGAADEYALTLARVLHLDQGQWPRFDLLLLGMGDDGHTASLFPGMAALDERVAWVVGTEVPPYVRPQVSRVTLTLPVLNNARAVLFLVTGQAKAERMRQVLTGASGKMAADGGELLPAARVRPHEGTLTWLLDEAAHSPV